MRLALSHWCSALRLRFRLLSIVHFSFLIIHPSAPFGESRYEQVELVTGFYLPFDQPIFSA